MPFTATPVKFEVRFGEHHHKYGDPYTGVATLTRIGNKGYVSLTCGTGLTVALVREMLKCCRSQGIWPVEWTHNDLPQQSRDNWDI